MLDRLLLILPLSWHSRIQRVEEITEFALDVGRCPEIRYGKEKVFLEDLGEITSGQLAAIISMLGMFGPDNRAGMDRTLHRISRIVSCTGEVTGLTCRVGRHIEGCARMLEDLVEEGQSILLLGAPGCGKTTKLRDICRFASCALDRSVVIVDTSNEIAGDGHTPHPAVGRARRLQVPPDRCQHQVMQEAVENHTPEVLVVDEIGNREEAEACRTFAQRGVQLIATAHGRTLEDIVLNPELRDLVGGIKSAPISDDRMHAQNLESKFVTQRISTPTFTVIVEIIDYNTVAVHRDVAGAVDCLLRGGEVFPEIRALSGDDGDWDITSGPRLVEPRRASSSRRDPEESDSPRKDRTRWSQKPGRKRRSRR